MKFKTEVDFYKIFVTELRNSKIWRNTFFVGLFLGVLLFAPTIFNVLLALTFALSTWLVSSLYASIGLYLLQFNDEELFDDDNDE